MSNYPWPEFERVVKVQEVITTACKVLRLYREEYAGFNVLHFHEKLTEDRGITLATSGCD